MSPMRKRIAERLKDSQNTAAMLTTFQEVDMGTLIDLRKRYKEDFAEKHGVKLGFMSAFIKASAAALMEIPAVNAGMAVVLASGNYTHSSLCSIAHHPSCVGNSH